MATLDLADTVNLGRHRDEIFRITAGLSRTVTRGEVDVSSSSAKAALVDTEVVRSIDKGTLESAVDSAVDLLTDLGPAKFDSALLMEVNRRVSAEVFLGGFRTYDVPKYGYLPHVGIQEDCDRFAERVRTTSKSERTATVCRTLFDVHWSVNLRGHYFQDACGRTASVVGCWLSQWMCGRIVSIPPRDEYLKIPLAKDPEMAWLSACVDDP